MYIILAVLLFAAVFGMFSRIYKRNWDKDLNVELKISTNGLFEGEQAKAVEIISNNKPIPIFWASVQFQVPGALRFGDAHSGSDYYREDRMSLFSYEEITKKFDFTAVHRGCYRLSDLQFMAGDLGFQSIMIKSFPSSPLIYVYPRAKEVPRFRIDYKKIIGDSIARRNVVEDPFFFRGIRDYYPFDSMKNINWKATAHTSSLKVNQYHTTQSRQVMLLLDLDGYNRLDGQRIKEDAISVAACLARKLAFSGVAVGFVTNAADVLSGGEIQADCKSGRGHFLYLMRKMAKINTDKLLTPFDRVLENILKRSDTATQYILISYYYGEGLVRWVSQLESAGRSIQWIFLHARERGINFTRRPGMYICEEAQ